MKFAIITHVPHILKNRLYYGYGPYVREMNIWLTQAEEVLIVAPTANIELTPIHECYDHPKIHFFEVSNFDITTFKNAFKTFILLPKIFMTTYKVMSQADHIHLRCPGNMGLIGTLVQMLFPSKPKTAKYAGNWDPNSKQPFTYKLQRWILSNTFLTKNMQVLVYGDWESKTINIRSFFTATYSEIDKLPLIERNLNVKINFLFVGTLSKGKQPLYVIQLLQKLRDKGVNAFLTFYGEGEERNLLETYIKKNNLQDYVVLKGNQTKETIIKAYQNSHFLVLPSKSEGWPKVVAEAMFWGCVPIASPVSCVSFMLGNGSRGILLNENLEQDASEIVKLLNSNKDYQEMAVEGSLWSRHYTTELFESEIIKLLQP